MKHHYYFYRKFGFTLAEVFHPLRMSRKFAFTLSEVLITLGIIGVVAALTMPSLIANHRKNVVLSQLKKSYTTLAQVLTTSTSQNGDWAEWGMDSANNMEEVSIQLSKIVKQNFIPYLKVSKDCEFDKCPFSQNSHTPVNNQVIPWHNQRGHYVLYLQDGTRVLFAINNKADTDGNTMFCDLIIDLDVNGNAGPNIYGKDIFRMYLDANSKKILLHNADNPSREVLFEACKNRGAYCGGLIQHDGWQIAPDYPWL